MDNTLLSLAYVTSLWEQKKNIFDAYIPIVSSSIIDMWDHQSPINHAQVGDWVKEKYGLSNFTYGAARSILDKMSKKNILVRVNGEYQVNKDEIVKFVQTPTIDFESEMNRLVKQIMQYAKTCFHVELEEEQVTSGLMRFLDTYATELVLRKNKLFHDKIETVKDTQKVKFIISKYILDNDAHDADVVNLLGSLAKGYLLSNIISFDNLDIFVGNLNGIIVALDAPIIYNLLSLNGESNYKLTKELIDLLQEKGAKLVVFNENDGEVVNTIHDAIYRLRKGNYDLRYCSRLLKTAILEHYSASYLETKLGELATLYERYSIETRDAPDFPPKYSEIDIDKLKEYITDKYTNKGTQALPEHLKAKIDTDVTTVSYIFRMRGSKVAGTLKQSKAILVSTNKVLACASRLNNISNVRHLIPPCVTDVFLSTIIWQNFPKQCENLNHNILMSESYANIELDDKLLQMYYEDLERKYKEQVISKETYVLASTSNLISTLLEEKTLNDRELYTDETVNEIIYEINAEKDRKYHDEQNSHQKDLNRIRKISRFIANCIFWFLWLILAGLFVWVKVWKPQSISWCDWRFLLWGGIVAFSGIFGLLSYAQIFPTKVDFIHKLENIIYRLILGKD